MNSAIIIAFLLITASHLVASQAPAASPKSPQSPSPTSFDSLPTPASAPTEYASTPTTPFAARSDPPVASPILFPEPFPANSPDGSLASDAPLPMSFSPEAPFPFPFDPYVPYTAEGPDAAFADQIGGAARSAVFFCGSMAALIAVAAF